MSQPKLVDTQFQDGIVVITINNPPLNILSLPVLTQLKATVQEADTTASVKGLVVTGAGEKAFSAGADIRSFQRMAKEELLDYVKLGQDTFTLIEQMRKPVAGAIKGAALGGGNELILSCDYRVASYDARFGQPEVNIGMIPGWGGTQRLPRLVGKAKALEMILSGQLIDASEALRIGLVNRVASSSQVVDIASSFVRHVTRLAPVAIAEAKSAVGRSFDGDSISEGLEAEFEAVVKVASTSDLKEGIEAFLNKRPPHFTGK
ncbi:MAG: enoyl-CoA hydratase/isomerase family protein [Thaumarchaeota archaeon]|nr:enoyl-CoA hydratase/isomerase family protein [Nitrososphaerota archaeon]